MTSGAGAIPIMRGCGRRISSGIYAECGMGAGGRPVEDFLICAPVPVTDPEHQVEGLLAVPFRGTMLYEHKGVTHLIDHVGSTFYPNVADFIEEVRVAGVSVHIPGNLDFSRLTKDSRIMLTHSRARILNWQQYLPPERRCPKGHVHHLDGALKEGDACLGFVYGDLEDAEPVETEDGAPTLRVRRTMPGGFVYEGRRAAVTVVPRYQRALFASFPLTRLVVIKDEGSDHQAMSRVAHAGVPVARVDE